MFLSIAEWPSLVVVMVTVAGAPAATQDSATARMKKQTRPSIEAEHRRGRFPFDARFRHSMSKMAMSWVRFWICAKFLGWFWERRSGQNAGLGGPALPGIGWLFMLASSIHRRRSLAGG